MKQMPSTVKRAIELVGLFTAGAIIMLGKIIVMPLVLAFFLSILLMPVYRLLRKGRMPEIVAIALSIICLAAFVALVGWLFYSQVASLLDDFPAIQKNTVLHLDNLSAWVSRSFGLSPNEQLNFINEHSAKFFGVLETVLQRTVNSATDFLIFFGLMPVYIFLIIFYRHLFLQFIIMWVSTAQQPKLREVVPQLEQAVKHYLLGLLIQFTYIILLLGGALAVLGIKHGLLIGILFAFLNLIPYMGPLIGNILGVLITLAASSSLGDILVVFVAITIVQFLDNNILMPRIVGGQVKINALVSIVSIFIGGALAGVTGMFMAMPAVAVLKIIFDHSSNFKKWGLLFGDARPLKNPLF
ncbi:MAG TPA: AI-2E family transporter [Chitinophagaceae bacterium]|nr:AI-2E family transporter [Chitinophagaceae bacterium]